MHMRHAKTLVLSLTFYNSFLILSTPPTYDDTPPRLKRFFSTRAFEKAYYQSLPKQLQNIPCSLNKQNSTSIKQILLCAIQHGYAQGVDDILKQCTIDPNKTHCYGTYLYLAARDGHADVVRVLLDHKADPNRVRCGYSPLIYACLFGHLDIAQLLLEHGADPNHTENHTPPLQALVAGYIRQGSASYRSHTDFNVWENITKLLLQHGATVDSPDCSFRTPLMLLAMETPYHTISVANRACMAQLLLDQGADITIRETLQNKTALNHAVDNNLLDIISVLCRHQATQLCAAIRNNNLKTVQTWIESDQFHPNTLTSHTKHGDTLLHVACDAGYIKIVALLLKHGADVKQKNENQDTALHMICASSTDQSRSDLATLLLTHSAPIQAVNTQKRTPLMLAICANDPALVTTLLDAGAITDNVDTNRDTVLHLAARTGNIIIAYCLARTHRYSTQRNSDGKLPCELAAEYNNPEVTQILQQAYAREVLRVLPLATLRMLNTRISAIISNSSTRTIPQSCTGPHSHNTVNHTPSEQSHATKINTETYNVISNLSSYDVQSVTETANITLSPDPPAALVSDDTHFSTSEQSTFSFVDMTPIDVISLSSLSATSTEHEQGWCTSF